MKLEDLQLVSNLGQSLWTTPEQSRQIAAETVSAAAVLDTNPERAIEKALQALLERANKKGMYARVPNGFHALFPEERFILLALHRGNWSYERIARVIQEPVESVQQLAWNARVYLALSRYPTAPHRVSASCPEYDPQKPWTQKVLDEEAVGQEKLFLQAHLAGCQGCRDALVRAKEVYYQVQAQIDAMEAKLPQPGLTAQLKALVDQGQRIRYPSTATRAQAIGRFLERTDVRVVLLVWAAVFFWLRLKH